MKTADTFFKENKNLKIANILLGLFLWFGLCSDYSWNNSWVNIFFAPLVGLIGLLSLSKNRREALQQKKLINLISFWPSIIGGAPYLLLLILAVVPPFVLATGFWVSEDTSSTLIQKEFSPTGNSAAEVVFRPVGSYSGGSGRIEVTLSYPWFPLIRREIYFLSMSHADENTDNYLSWIDNDTLYIYETKDTIKINWVEWQVPFIIMLPFEIYSLFDSS